jgi:hypothetical protein
VWSWSLKAVVVFQEFIFDVKMSEISKTMAC